MKNIILILMGCGMFVFLGCQDEGTLSPVLQNDQANTLAKPAANLIGAMDIDFLLTPPTFWNGTVDFGVVGKYSMTFISHGPPRDFSQASPFEENFIIYELGTDWTIEENVYLKGRNAGVVSHANDYPNPAKFVANGKVEEAYGPFEGWQGRNVHIRGVFTWESPGLPEGALATIRIN